MFSVSLMSHYVKLMMKAVIQLLLFVTSCPYSEVLLQSKGSDWSPFHCSYTNIVLISTVIISRSYCTSKVYLLRFNGCRQPDSIGMVTLDKLV